MWGGGGGGGFVNYSSSAPDIRGGEKSIEIENHRLKPRNALSLAVVLFFWAEL